MRSKTSPLWIALALLSLATQAVATEFRDTEYGFSITPPGFSDSSEGQTVARLVVAAPAEDGFAANINVNVQHVATTREEFVKLSEDQFVSNGMSLIAKENRTVSGRPAVLMEYQGAWKGPSLHFLALAVILPERVLLVTCTALKSSYSRYEGEFRRSLESFKLTSAP